MPHMKKLELCEEMQIVEPNNKKIYVRQLITEEKQREKSITKFVKIVLQPRSTFVCLGKHLLVQLVTMVVQLTIATKHLFNANKRL